MGQLTGSVSVCAVTTFARKVALDGRMGPALLVLVDDILVGRTYKNQSGKSRESFVGWFDASVLVLVFWFSGD